jgi:hypothetical protein
VVEAATAQNNTVSWRRSGLGGVGAVSGTEAGAGSVTSDATVVTGAIKR